MFELLVISGVLGTLWWAAQLRVKRTTRVRPPIVPDVPEGPREIPRPPPIPDPGEPQPRLIRFLVSRTADHAGRPGVALDSDSIWAARSGNPANMWLDVAEFPIDVLVSVPNDFLEPRVQLGPGVELVDGAGGRDLLFRVSQPAVSHAEEPGYYLTTDFSILVSTGYALGRREWIEAPVRILAVPYTG